MTSTDGRRGEPLTLHAELKRAFRDAKVPGSLAAPLAVGPEAAADIAARIAGPFIKQARADERQQCISFLRTEVTVQRVIALEASGPAAEEAAAEAAAYEAAIGLLTSRMHGLAIGQGEESADPEAAARADERRLCATRLRDWAATARQRREHVAATTAAWLANEIDPLGPVQGAPASGGTA